MTALPDVWSIKVIPQRYISLPWQDIERYGPYRIGPHENEQWSDNPPKGTVKAEGVVDISGDVLYEVHERSTDDYLRGSNPPSVSQHAKWALVQAGLASEETRGGIHGTDALEYLLKRMNTATHATA